MDQRLTPCDIESQEDTKQKKIERSLEEQHLITSLHGPITAGSFLDVIWMSRSQMATAESTRAVKD